MMKMLDISNKFKWLLIFCGSVTNIFSTSTLSFLWESTMTKFIIRATIAVVILMPFQATAQDNNIMNAANLLKACTTPDMEWISFCNGFFQAVHDQQTSLGKLCTPVGTTRTIATEIFYKEAVELLSRYPDQGLRPAVDVAGEILVEKFPCR